MNEDKIRRAGEVVSEILGVDESTNVNYIVLVITSNEHGTAETLGFHTSLEIDTLPEAITSIGQSMRANMRLEDITFIDTNEKLN